MDTKSISEQFLDGGGRGNSLFKNPSGHIFNWVTLWRNGRASDLRSRGREIDPRPGVAA